MMDGGSAQTETIEALADRLSRDFATRAARHDREASFPFENFEALHQAGLLRLTVPRDYGGLGRGLREIVAVVSRIAQGDAATALVLTMQLLQHAAIARSTRWPEALRARLGRETGLGVALINALRVEPELGTPARGGLPATRARRMPDGWRISGRKIYSTGAPGLTWGVVWGATDDEAPLVGQFLVPLAADGVSIVETWDHLGMRASGSHDIVLDDVLIPADHAADLRPPAEWAVPDPVQVAWGTVTVAALYDGIARAARDWLVSYLKQRAPGNLGAPLASLPRFQQALGEIDALLLVNRRLLDQVVAEPDQVEQAGLIKYLVTGNAIRAVERGLELTGNPGLSRANPLERHYRDVLCSRIHTPQNDMILAEAGRAAFGL